MTTITQEVRFDLLKNELVRLSNARNHTLSCSDGQLWITQDGDALDVILASGERYTFQGSGQIAVSALKTSVLSIRHERNSHRSADQANGLEWSVLCWEPESNSESNRGQTTVF